MDATEQLIKKLSQKFASSILHQRRFGRSDQSALWLDVKGLHAIASFIKDEAPELDLLENLSFMQMDDALVATYFLRGHDDAKPTLLLRATASVPSDTARVDFPSVSEFWPTAHSMEAEAAELFGIQFRLQGGTERIYEEHKLPADWQGFPLRKAYIFPTEVYGIAHSRGAPEKKSETANELGGPVDDVMGVLP